MHQLTLESTTRTLRGVLQGILAFATLIVALAIPPVGDGINAVLGLLPFVHFEVTPGLVTAIGAVGLALTALVTKLQNVFEHRDDHPTVEQYAVQATELADLVKRLTESLGVARSQTVVALLPTGEYVAGEASTIRTGATLTASEVGAAVIPVPTV